MHLTNKKEANKIYLHFYMVPSAASLGIFMERMVYMKLSVHDRETISESTYQ